MRTIAALLALGIVTTLALPSAVATHGDSATVITVSGLVLRGDYDFGPGNDDQWWDWTVYGPLGPDRCEDLKGSVENGQVGVCASGATLVIGRTGEYHPYPYTGLRGLWGLDPHQIKVTYAGAQTDAVHIACDNGGTIPRFVENPCLYKTI